MDYKRLSKTVARALRHAPRDYDLDLDPEGWVAIDDLLAALRPRRREWRNLAADDLTAMLEQATKRRYEICDERIRAYYGHSVPERIEKEPAVPPDILFHGTTPDAAETILHDGLRSMSRQYVHLSTDRETAHLVGGRRTPDPVILTILAAEAHRAGVAFYEGNDDVWLADAVPPEFIQTP
ncbi:MAG: RNA 2'-phosphotransferase [Anaerolineae bacterium]|nr:RNA 2'-phosphotransferase [Anaerolineae bacterium]